jgi:hypothetical protein
MWLPRSMGAGRGPGFSPLGFFDFILRFHLFQGGKGSETEWIIYDWGVGVDYI